MPVFATLDPELGATVLERRPLVYSQGRARGAGGTRHVRAGSGLAWVGPKLAIVQDDTYAVALHDPATGETEAFALPQEGWGGAPLEGEAAEKATKLDLESCLVFPGRTGAPGEKPEPDVLVAFGSGSTPRRERVVTVADPLSPRRTIEVFEASTLYACFRAETRFSGSELNLEGVALVGDEVVFLNRGNGARSPEGHLPVNALARVDAAELRRFALRRGSVAPPLLRGVRSFDLGSVEGTPLTFTDAAARPRDLAREPGATYYLAAAEASANSYDDGEVRGAALGWIDAETTRARYALLRDEAGEPFRAKAEGLVFDRADAARAWIVLDRDDPTVPADLCLVALEGPWA